MKVSDVSSFALLCWVSMGVFVGGCYQFSVLTVVRIASELIHVSLSTASHNAWTRYIQTGVGWESDQIIIM